MDRLAALITACILERPLCLGCLKIKASGDAPSILAGLDRIKTVLALSVLDAERCRACGTIGLTYSLARREP